MIAKQLSVFIENRQGRLGEVLKVLKENDVNIISLSLADTTEFGLLRLIVSDDLKGKQKLSEAGFSTMLTDVLIVKISHVAGSLQNLVQVLSKENVNIEYMYGLSIANSNAYIVIKPSDIVASDGILEKSGVKTIDSAEIINLK